jgi:hypothetical protein
LALTFQGFRLPQAPSLECSIWLLQVSGFPVWL